MVQVMIAWMSHTSIGDNIMISKLFCSLESRKDLLFFSLVDYRNNYFTSDDPKRILEFYNSFENRDQLIQWMRERPNGVATIHEVDGDKDIIVVIPTADFNGKFAQNCINIFKGFHIIFVESGGRGDYYFNIARNIDTGLKHALQYKPKWLIFSGDDIISVKNLHNLRQRLSVINNGNVGIVFPVPFSNYYSCKNNIYSEKKISPIFFRILSSRFPMFKAMLTIRPYSNKFGVKYFAGPDNLLNRIFFRKIFSFVDQHTFAIFNVPMIRDLLSSRGYLFNPFYINNREDAALAIDIKNSIWKYEVVKLKLRTLKSGTLSNGILRGMRGLPSDVLFSDFIEDLLRAHGGMIA